jgi:hypothetical protein
MLRRSVARRATWAAVDVPPVTEDQVTGYDWPVQVVADVQYFAISVYSEPAVYGNEIDADPLAGAADPTFDGGVVPTLRSTTDPVDVDGVTVTLAEALVVLCAATPVITTPVPPVTVTQFVAAGSAGDVEVAATAGHDEEPADITKGFAESPV